MIARIVVMLLWGFASALLSAQQRVVSTAPAITEALYALGLGDRVVGVTTFCNYPPAAKVKPKIGTYLQPNYEAIVALSPDLVIIEKSLIPFQSKFAALRLKTLAVGHESVDEFLESIRQIARATGVPSKGEEVAGGIRQSLDSLAAQTKKLPRRKLLFIVGRNPGELTGLIAVGRGSYLNELISAAGGVNVFGDATQSYLRISAEQLLARDPEVIVDMGDMADTGKASDAQRTAVVRLYDQQPKLAAVRRRAVHAVAADLFVVPGPRAVDAARAFARMLHPEVFR